MAPSLLLTAVLSLSALLLLAQADYQGLLVAVQDRIESISAKANTSNTLHAARTVLALSSPVFSGQQSHKFAFMFATELGCRGPSVYRIEGSGQAHSVLLSPEDVNSNSLLYFESAAFDQEGNKLFLTNRQERTIYSLDNKPGSKLEKFYSDNEKYPSSITVDECTRTLYWINSNRRSPSIEISQLTTNQSWTLIDGNLTQPKALTFDSAERKLYWAAVDGGKFSVSRASPDGTERETVCQLQDHAAFSLAVDSDFIYWSEWSSFSVWRAQKNTAGICRPELVRSFPSSKPHGLAVIREEKLNCDGAEAGQPPQRPAQDISQPEPETVTEPESDPRCDGLCLQGDCQLRMAQPPSCQCKEGWRGARCEVSVCHNFCLHDGECLVIEDQPECVCQHGHTGDRCQLIDVLDDHEAHDDHDKDDVQYCDQKTDLPTYLLSAVTAVLALAVLVLSVAVHRLRLRPRVVRKRFISVAGGGGKKTEARPSCGLPVEDGVQLDIENCCNMTLCETPCFEPPTRGPKKGRKSKRCKGDKASLLDNCDDE